MKKPKYEELAQSLLRKINRGLYTSGKLPAMSAIAREYGVNLQTANRAVKFLEQRGIVNCYAGKRGTVIDPARASLSAVRSSGDHSFLVDQVFGSTQRKKIRFLLPYFNEKIQHCFKTCAELFTRRYPWVEVELIPYDNIRRLENKEINYDTVLLIGRDVNRFAAKGEFLDLKSYPSLVDLREEEFIPGVWSLGYYQQKLVAVPFSWCVPLCAARNNSEPFSWQAPEADCRHAGAFNIGFYSLVCLFLGEPMALENFQDKEKNLKDLLEFLKKISLTPEGELNFWDNPAELRNFNSREKHFLCGYYSNINYFLQNNADFHYLPLPAYPGGKRVMVTEYLAVNAQTQTAPECLLWLKFLQSKAGQKEFLSATFFLPIYREMLQQLSPELAVCLETAVQDAVQPRLSSAGLYRLYSCVYPLLARYFTDEITEREIIEDIFELLREEIILDNM